MEIERKYLVKEIPMDLNQYKSIEMMQGYISTSPTIRIRQENDKYLLTTKSEGDIARLEYELPITKEEFEGLFGKIEGIFIKKTRYLIPIHDNLTAELDVFKDEYDGLITVEVEFDTLEEANHFIPPLWFGEDVSLEKKYKNGYLSKSYKNFN